MIYSMVSNGLPFGGKDEGVVAPWWSLTKAVFSAAGLSLVRDVIHQLPGAKLREIFGAETALYITAQNYGSKFVVIDSAIVVAIVLGGF